MCGTAPPLPQYNFMVWCSVKVQGQLYLGLSSVTISQGSLAKFLWNFSTFA